MIENPFIDDPEFFECTLITVPPEAAEKARAEVTGCEQCSADVQILFDCILSDVMRRPGMYEFVLEKPLTCPVCLSSLTEKTGVARGGIEVDAPACAAP